MNSATASNGWPGHCLADGKPIRRVLFFGCNMSRSRCTGGLVDALRSHGLEVKWLNMATLRRRLGARLARSWARAVHRRYQPDLVFVFHTALPMELLSEFRAQTPTVLWMEEALEGLDEQQIDYLRQGHLVAMSNPARFPILREHGLDNMIFEMSGFSPRFHHPVGPMRKRCDVAFIGASGKNSFRGEVLAAVSERFSTEIFGARWEGWKDRSPRLKINGPIKPRGYRRVCATSRIVIGLNEVNDDELYFSNRTWLTLACGGFHLTHYVPKLEKVFTDGEHLAWFDGLDECLEKIEYYLAHDVERERIARTGHELAMAHHQYAHRVSDILEALSEIDSRGLRHGAYSEEEMPFPGLRAEGPGKKSAGASRISTTPVAD